MQYFAYENWRARGHVTKVHRQNCSFCNDGRGKDGGTRSDNGRWLALGEFDQSHYALAAAQLRITQGEVRLCGTCS